MNSASILTLLAGCALLCVGGCASKQMTADILVVDGCMIEIKGVSSLTADEIKKNWTIGDDCTLNAVSSTGEDDGNIE